jgi:O-antigen ligase
MLLRMTLIIGALGGVFIVILLQSDVVVREFEQQGQERATLFFLNPITIGYHGLFTAMAGLMLLTKYRSPFWVISSTVGIVLGAYLMVASGSRGPFVALVLGLLFIGAANRRASGASLAAVLIVGAGIAWLGLQDGVVNRFLAVGADESSLERIYAINQSISLALANPLFGYAYIEPVTGFYPHNMIIEAGLALGLAGAVTMVWMQFSILVNAWRHARNGKMALPFLGVAMIANAWISGAIWGSALFFMLLWTLRETTAPREADQGRPAPGKLAGR